MQAARPAGSDPLDEPGRNAADHRIWLDVLRHHGARRHHRILAHGHAGQDGGAGPDPAVALQVHGFADQRLVVVVVVVVGRSRARWPRSAPRPRW